MLRKQKRGKQRLLKYVVSLNLTQVTFTCSNSAMETLEKGVKYVQS